MLRTSLSGACSMLARAGKAGRKQLFHAMPGAHGSGTEQLVAYRERNADEVLKTAEREMQKVFGS